MKVLHVYKTFLGDTVGGVEQVIAHIGGAADHATQHSVVSVSNHGLPAVATWSGMQHLRYKQTLSVASNPMSYSLLRAFKRLVLDYDVIHYHFPWPFADLMHWMLSIKKPSVLTYHADIVRQKQLLRLYRPLMHYFLNAVDCIVATSPNYALSSPVLQRYAAKVSVIPIGLNQQQYPAVSLERQRYWQARLGARFFLFVGVMRYYKGLHDLLHALQGTQLPVVLVGTGPVEAELKRLAVQLALTHVYFLGALDELDKTTLLRLCYGIVFPSHLRAEAFGVSLLEGAMFGKPLLSCEIGTGTSYINVHGITGYVVPPNDPVALRTALYSLWNDPEHSQLLGQQAQKRYAELFTASRMAEEYGKVYRRILHNS